MKIIRLKSKECRTCGHAHLHIKNVNGVKWNFCSKNLAPEVQKSGKRCECPRQQEDQSGV